MLQSRVLCLMGIHVDLRFVWILAMAFSILNLGYDVGDTSVFSFFLVTKDIFVSSDNDHCL